MRTRSTAGFLHVLTASVAQRAPLPRIVMSNSSPLAAPASQIWSGSRGMTIRLGLPMSLQVQTGGETR